MKPDLSFIETSSERARFSRALAFVLAQEGGFANQTADPGGPTYHGITQRLFDRWLKTQGSALRPLETITPSEIAQIYYAYFWRAAHAAELPPPLDLVVFDTAVLDGPDQAVRLLQQVLGVNQDGIVGPCTLEAAAKTDPSSAAQRIIEQRRAFYRALVSRRPELRVFLHGWMNRLDRLALAVQGVAAA